MNQLEPKFVGVADGPEIFVPELGCAVKTFTTPPGGKNQALNFHVPLKCRGNYRPEQLANYSAEKTYRTDALGYQLCMKKTKAGLPCEKRAVNRVFTCILHGGRLHPLDKLVDDKEPEELSRYQLFKAGQITMDDLDDEELAVCGFRAKDGRIYKPRNIPRDMTHAFQKAIFDRATQELRANTVDAAKTLAEIMKNKTIEPDIRLKAASIMLDRNLGKAPQVVALTADKAFEEIFSDIFSGPRDESRRNRAEVIDAEVISNPKHFERNPAILAQEIEVKPFEYDLTDRSQDVKKATQKRYASRALGVDLTTPDYPLKRIEENGFIRWVDPNTPRPSKKAETRRKTYTLSDFD